MTSEVVTKMDSPIKMMIIQVIRDILLSDTKSERTSAKSRNTRHLSFNTCIRGLISRYSRTAVYKGCNVGSLSQMKFGASSTFEAACWSVKMFPYRRGQLTEVDLDTALEETAHEFYDLFSFHSKFTCQGQTLGNVLCFLHLLSH